MKKFMSILLALVMLAGIIPAFAAEESGAAYTDIFGWNFTAESEVTEPSVVSWNDYRGMFLLLEMPGGLTAENLDTHRVTGKLTLTLTPNNENQDFTATVFGIAPEAVENASLFINGSSKFSAEDINTKLVAALGEKEMLGIMQVTAEDNTKSYTVTSKTLELTDYIREHAGEKYIGLYLSNREEDVCYSYGMAHYDGTAPPKLEITMAEYDRSVPEMPDVNAAGLREISAQPSWIQDVPYADTENEYANFYKKAVYVYGLPICATDDVPDEALFKAYDVIEVYLRKIYYDYPEILEHMIENRVNIIIIGENEYNWQHPSWRYWEDKTERRGGGGINTTVLVEDLLVPENDGWRQTFAGLVHEFTHTTLTYGIGDAGNIGARNDIYEKINAAYEKAAAANMYPSPNEYDISNYHEYFAGQVGRWFNGSPTDLPVDNAGSLTDREQLEAYDPNVYEICKMLYAPLELPTPWGSGANSLTDGEGGEYVLENEYLKVAIGKYGQISSLKIADDMTADFCDTDYMLNENNAPQQGADEKEHHWFGEMLVKARTDCGDWISSDTSTSEARDISRGENSVTVSYKGGEFGNGVQNVQLAEEYKLNGDALEWSISVTNPTSSKLEVGDLGISMPFNEYWTPAYNGEELYDTRVLAHSFVGRDSSYIYATRPSGQGKMLLLSPDPSTGAGFEYRDNWRNNNGHYGSLWAQDNGGWHGGLNVYYIHSNVIKSTGSGYIGSTSLMLTPGETKTYTFRFKSVADESQLKTELYNQGIVDAVAVPGFAYAKDMPAKFYLHANDDIDIQSVVIECVHQSGLYRGLSNSVNNNLPHEGGAKVKYRSTKIIDGERYMIYDLKLTCLGANHVIVNYTYKGEERSTTLQFYLMDNVSEALNLHSDFLVEKTQINTPGETGDKAFDDWMMDSKTTRSETMNGYWEMSYWGWGDDWGLTHGTFLAQKNVYMPVKSQVDAVDEYLDTAIWNGLMREHQEDYLIHDFLSVEPNASPTYRGYAYPHIYNTYFAMYRIADKYPNLTEYKESKETYLLRAYNILNALYYGPVAYNWATGIMGEITTPDIIEALEKEGYYEEAENVRSIMNGKYDNFKNTKYPYGSEYSYDNTGEEAVYTLAKLQDNTEMMQKIDRKTRACRGLQPVWYYYGVPTTICGESWWNFQYTAALAGYCMDDWLRLQDNGKTSAELSDAERVNYAAKLANLTCINSGQIDSDPENTGASAWTYQAFLGHSGGQGTGGGMLHNGWRQMSGESDLGLFGAMEILSADIATDNIFGLFGYGCEVKEVRGTYNVVPLDGVASRLNLINEKIYIELESDRYNSASVRKNGSIIRLTLENLEGTAHNTEITVTGLPEGSYRLIADGKEIAIIKAAGETVFSVPVSEADTCSVEISAVSGRAKETAPVLSINAPEKATVGEKIRLVGYVSEQSSAQWTTNADAEFSNPDKPVTEVVVKKSGIYTFTLTAEKNGKSSTETVDIDVTEPEPLPEEIYSFSSDRKGIVYGNIFENGIAHIDGNVAHGYIRLPFGITDRLDSFTVQTKIKLNDDQTTGATLWSIEDIDGNGINVSFEAPGKLLLNVVQSESISSAAATVGLTAGAEKTVTVTGDGNRIVLYLNDEQVAEVQSPLKLKDLGEVQRNFIGRGTDHTTMANIDYFSFRILSRAISPQELEKGETAAVTSVGECSVATTIGTVPVLPETVTTYYSDGTYRITGVTWDAPSAESYASTGAFTVSGIIENGMTVTAKVYVISEEPENIAQLASPSAIVDTPDDLGGVKTMNDGFEPASSADTNHGAWHNWGGGNQGEEAWVMYEWDSEVVVTGTELYYFKDGNGNFLPASAEFSYLAPDGSWVTPEIKRDDGINTDKFNITEFAPFVTTKVRLTMKPSALGCGIIEWRVNGSAI